jgi:hypothetical protein
MDRTALERTAGHSVHVSRQKLSTARHDITFLDAPGRAAYGKAVLTSVSQVPPRRTAQTQPGHSDTQGRRSWSSGVETGERTTSTPGSFPREGRWLGWRACPHAQHAQLVVPTRVCVSYLPGRSTRDTEH